MERAEIVRWLKENNPEKLQELYSMACSVKRRVLKDTVCVHGIIEFSNYCFGGRGSGEKYRNDGCLYCGLRGGNSNLVRYRMRPEDIVSLAVYAANELGFKMLVLQSGIDFYYSTEMLTEIIKEIRRQAKVLLFLSIGERTRIDYQKLWDAGARGMLFRFETSDTLLYAALHPGGKLENRLKHLRMMKEIGFILASGPMLGIPSPWPEKIPDQTLESIADDILLMKDLGVKMATFGPYIKATDAVLARLRPEVKHGEAELVLKVIALTRLTMPGVRIPCTTALEAVGRETVGIENIRRQAIKAGATAFMLSLTPPEFFQHYRLYKGKNEGCFMSRKTMNDLLKVIRGEKSELCASFGKKSELSSDDFNQGLCVEEH